MVPRGIYAHVRAAQGRGSRRGGSTARPAAARCLKVALRGKVKARPPRRLARAVADDLAPEARDMCPHALHTHCRGGPWRVVAQTFQKRAPKQRQGTQRRFFCSFAGQARRRGAGAHCAPHGRTCTRTRRQSTSRCTGSARGWGRRRNGALWVQGEGRKVSVAPGRKGAVRSLRARLGASPGPRWGAHRTWEGGMAGGGAWGRRRAGAQTARQSQENDRSSSGVRGRSSVGPIKDVLWQSLVLKLGLWFQT